MLSLEEERLEKLSIDDEESAELEEVEALAQEVSNKSERKKAGFMARLDFKVATHHRIADGGHVFFEGNVVWMDGVGVKVFAVMKRGD